MKKFKLTVSPRTTFDFQNNLKCKKPVWQEKALVISAVNEALVYENFMRPCQVSVTFTDNAGIHELNKEFRDVDRATDVLSFPMYDFRAGEEPIPGERVELGDIVLSLERAKEQAAEFGHSYAREVAFLTVHSVLHLLGYDHELSDEDDLTMRRHQKEILESMHLER